MIDKPIIGADYIGSFLRYISAFEEQRKSIEKENLDRIETVFGMSLSEMKKLHELKLKLEEHGLLEKFLDGGLKK